MLENKTKTQRMVITALFGALTCVATLLIRIPSPTGGYANLGDTLVLLSAFLLGGWNGVAAADFFGGYLHYMPATLLIKALMAATASVLYQVVRRGEKRRSLQGALVGGVAAEFLMVMGYYLFALIFLKKGAAAALTIIGDAAQGAIGIVGATALLIALQKSNIVD